MEEEIVISNEEQYEEEYRAFVEEMTEYVRLAAGNPSYRIRIGYEVEPDYRPMSDE